MRGRSDVLETAILGLLHEAPLHGYELRKRLNLVLGSFRALSYGSLYPALRALTERGLIVGSTPALDERVVGTKRARIVYELTADGKEQLQRTLTSAGPATWEDESFDMRFALFAQTDSETRLRILEGRRTRMAERLELVRASLTRTRERMDSYTLELQRHGLEQVEREVRWLDGLIDAERSGAARTITTTTDASSVRRPATGHLAGANPHAESDDVAEAHHPEEKE